MKTIGFQMTPQKSNSRPPRPVITDVCLITPHLDSSIDFYVSKLGFQLRSRMPGFADFKGPGLILALWENSKLLETTSIAGQTDVSGGRTVMLACELESPAAIDALYQEYLERGIEFHCEPRDYPWNARCIYFDGPNGEFWEFFAWYEGGEPGIIDDDPANERNHES